MLVFKNADSMSSWRHEIHDFQTGNFISKFVCKRLCLNSIHKVFLLYRILKYNKGTFCTGKGKFVPRQRACESAREVATEDVGVTVEPKVLALVHEHFLWHIPYLERVQGVINGVQMGPVGPPGAP
jgi:hypothetical protein